MNDLTLESVKEAFQQWRSARYSRAEPIPEALWSMALGLYPQYKRSKICHLLGLSGNQFKRRLEDTRDVCVNGFVVASCDEVKATPEINAKIQLIVQGKERALTLCVEVHLLSQVLPQLGALL